MSSDSRSPNLYLEEHNFDLRCCRVLEGVVAV